MTGPIVTIEGLHGSGKSTLARALAAAVPGAVTTRYLDKEVFWHRLLLRFPTSLSIMYALSRDQRTRLVDLSNKHPLVIQDRGLWSERTHLPNARRFSTRLLGRLFTRLGREPDLYVFIDADPDLCHQRVLTRDSETTKPIEPVALIKERATLFTKLANKSKRCLIIPTGDVSTMVEAVLSELHRRYPDSTLPVSTLTTDTPL